jgi:hypothetical protein
MSGDRKRLMGKEGDEREKGEMLERGKRTRK